MNYDPSPDPVPPPAPAPQPPAGDLPLTRSDAIQGNVLAGFNKDHQTFVFLRFPDDAASARAWLGALAPRVATTRQVATFNRQFSEARRNRGGDDPENLKAVWVNLGLTAAGLTALSPGLAPDLDAFEAFRAGPAARAEMLNDKEQSAPSRWVVGGLRDAEVHGVLTVAADERDDLLGEVEKMRALAAEHGLLVVYEQRGDTLPGKRAGHEHFGFKDGISQPGVVGFHEEDEARLGERKGHPGTDMIQPGEFVLGHPRQNGAPRSCPDWMRDGSFQVWRRLAQDVPGWWAQVTRVQRDALPSDDPREADRLAARLVGRWRSGTPLEKAPDRDNRSSRDRAEDNDFEFVDDPEGFRTPRFAHIRKMYPRGDEAVGPNERRIIRRGIPFGRHFDPGLGRGHGEDADRGLLFNVFMSSIEEQFEFLQKDWANNPSFRQANDGPDPVIGENPAPVSLKREGRPDEALDFRRFVHTTGAVYAFAPSVPTLFDLAAGQS